MNSRILELEKSLFQYKYMTNIEYLNKILDENYIEIGKSGRKFNKNDVITDLSSLKEDRKIIIYNFSCNKIDEKTYLVHYITKDENNNNIYRTSIWQEKFNEFIMTFHQASLYKEDVTLIKF